MRQFAYQTRSDPFWHDALTLDQNKCVEMRRNGFSVKAIAEEMMIADRTVKAHLIEAKRYGVSFPPVMSRRGGRQQKQIVELAAQGALPDQIAGAVGTTVETVRTQLSYYRRNLRAERRPVPEWLQTARDRPAPAPKEKCKIIAQRA